MKVQNVFLKVSQGVRWIMNRLKLAALFTLASSLSSSIDYEGAHRRHIKGSPRSTISKDERKKRTKAKKVAKKQKKK